MKLQYIGEADFGYPLYKDENDKLWANTNYNLNDSQSLYSLTGNSADGEPNYSFKSVYPNETVTFENEPDQRERTFRDDYAFLSRLESDCKYFLGYGKGNEKCLWAGNVKEHIEEMRKMWNKFPDDLKPKWLTMEQINKYEKNMEELKEQREKRLFERHVENLLKLGREYNNHVRFAVVEYYCRISNINPYEMANALAGKGMELIFDDASITSEENEIKKRTFEKFQLGKQKDSIKSERQFGPKRSFTKDTQPKKQAPRMKL